MMSSLGIFASIEYKDKGAHRCACTLQPVHELDDAVAPLGDVYTAAPHLGGLTPFGAIGDLQAALARSSRAGVRSA